MFERYTEKAKRTIFFARYEAGQCGSLSIETEHLLLGLLREDNVLADRFLGPARDLAPLLARIEGHATSGQKVPNSMDMPVSEECKRALGYGAEEATQLNHKHIGTAHLLLGLLREEQCFAAQLLRERHITLDSVREDAGRFFVFVVRG